ncbi:MAG: hypothetical protein ACE5F5_07845 [Acidimicrobiia bacterium]
MQVIQRPLRVLAVMGFGLAVAMGAFFLLVGVGETVVTIEGASFARRVPRPEAVIPALIGAVGIVAVVKGQKRRALLASLGLLLFAAAFMFSYGLNIAPAAILAGIGAALMPDEGGDRPS